MNESCPDPLGRGSEKAMMPNAFMGPTIRLSSCVIEGPREWSQICSSHGPQGESKRRVFEQHLVEKTCFNGAKDCHIKCRLGLKAAVQRPQKGSMIPKSIHVGKSDCLLSLIPLKSCCHRKPRLIHPFLGRVPLQIDESLEPKRPVDPPA